MHAPQSELAGIAETAAAVLARLRERRPRVHCITNAVAQSFTANVLLATGAVPSMTMSPAEVGDFAARADALLVNLGTFDGDRRAAAEAAIAQVRGRGVSWVLDPVLIDRSPPRAAYARSLLLRDPAAIRLNAAECDALFGTASPQAFAARQKTVVARTGETDLISDGARSLRIGNGHPLMARVTAMGCAESALVAAALAVEPDPFAAVAAALLIFGIAGDIAAEGAKGPGSFAVHILDVLFNLDGAEICARAKVFA
jgi:hydroxyethylthiazole kinase